MEEVEAVLGNKKLNNKLEAVRELRKNKKENLEDDHKEYIGSVPIKDQWDLFINVCTVLYEAKRYVTKKFFLNLSHYFFMQIY